MPTKSNNTGGRGGARPGAGRKKSAVKDNTSQKTHSISIVDVVSDMFKYH